MAKPELSRESLAWVAGFWDGEGCVGIANTNTTRGHPTFSIVQASAEAPVILQRVLDAVQVPGSLNGPYEYPRQPTWAPRWQLRITGYERVQAVLAMCWPWLSQTKRDQARAALETFHRTHPAPKRRTHCPKCGCDWVEPNIAYHVGANVWRCRVCRRKNPARSRPNGQRRRVHLEADETARRPSTHDRQRVVWD